MNPANPSQLKDKIRSVLARDPKKTYLMLVLAVVMLVLWARTYSGGPASATAAFIRKSVAAISDNQPANPQAALNSLVMTWLDQPKRLPSRNLFTIHLDYYARASDHKSTGNSLEDPAKSDTEAADQERERQILLENLQSQASKLKLQTTMMGTHPSALVNGDLVKEGDTVSGFKVVKIEPRKIVVEQDGVTLEIGMP